MDFEAREAALERARQKHITWSAMAEAPGLPPDVTRAARRLARLSSVLVMLREFAMPTYKSA
jgi:hypothetical protein